MRKAALLIFSALLIAIQVNGWGFWAHQKINHIAVFTLPHDMISFYKSNIQYLTEHATDPDKRRYVNADEAPRHFIDLEYYLGLPLDSVPRHWKEAAVKYTPDTLTKYGINPWYVQTTYFRLVRAFKEKDSSAILHYSADLGHYVADACVPLHASWNYNGQMTGQTGIHSFWETAVPVLLGPNYDYFVGKATYVEHPDSLAWQLVQQSHAEVDSVLRMEKILNSSWDEDSKYSIRQVKGKVVRTYSDAYIEAYNKLLNNMAERRMQTAIQAVGSLWMSAWVDAGQPILKNFKLPVIPEVSTPLPDSLVNLRWIGRPE